MLDERGQPLGGAVVSALGVTTAFAVSDPEGRFAFRNLPYGPYLVRAHLQGYVPARGRIIQVDQSTRGVSTIALTRLANADSPPEVLAAGVAPVGVATSGDASEEHDHGEVAWRLRHLKRSVLKESTSLLDDLTDDSFLDTSLAGLGHAFGRPARVATSILSDLPISGEVNLLTRTSFDRPQDLFSVDTWMPRGIAFLSLAAPTSSGDWTMRGAMTEGDLSSWIVAGSYVRRESATHRYRAGLSYGMQRYMGANADALAAVSDGSRNVGSVYVYDNWAVNPRLTLVYGAKYARYDYLAAQQGLISPRVTATIHGDELKIHATVSRRSVAPGAEEFIPPSTGLWLPPERTFSPVSPRNGLRPEHIDHYEIAAERDLPGSIVIGVRAFRQNVGDQLVTLFGVAPSGTAASTVGHYYVATGGDVETRGWGVSVSRDVADGLRASIDYTFAGANWIRGSSDTPVLSRVAASVVRDDTESFHDLTTTVESVLPVVETRVFVIYKINTRFADVGASGPRAGTRFDVQLNQSLPFLNFSSAQWEMLVAVRNLFRDELMDASMYDELLVVRPPKRIVGGVTVRF